MQIFSKPVTDIIESRKSVRTYLEEPLNAETKQKLDKFLTKVDGPFQKNVRIMLIDRTAEYRDKLGTYGVIRGACHFFVAAVTKGDRLALTELGYELEKCVLYATSLGLGTCWIGGTFYKSGFSKAAGLKGKEAVPVVCPVGIPAGRKSLLDKFLRASSGGDNRKAWSSLFFDGGPEHKLTNESAGRFATALNMLRLAPSAMNSQPWRIVKTGDRFDFFLANREQETHYIDIGIAMCHFDLTLKEEGIPGTWMIGAPVTQKYTYVATWRPQK